MADSKNRSEGWDIRPEDWDLNDEYFQNDDSAQELRLEDFISGSGTAGVSDSGASPLEEDSFGESPQEQLLKKTIQDVHQVLALAQEGCSISQIARQLELEESYVYNIQVSAQGFREDDEIAVAHLVLMG